MSYNLPAIIPSLARAFESEREQLRTALKDGDMSAPMVVTAARRALDRTGAEFTKQTEDVQAQKAGLWLLEMVKSGAGVLDTGARAEIIWREVPKAPARKIAGSTLFYGAAAVFGVAGVVQASSLTIGAAIVLAALRFFDPKDWKHMAGKLMFWKRAPLNVIEGPDGRKHLADTRVIVDSVGFVDGLADALRTADHILIRMGEPAHETHWRDNAQIMSLIQGLLEAKSAGDADFALRLIETELATLLNAEGIEVVYYSRKTQRLFDVLPGLDMEKGEAKVAAPALMSGDRLLKRGSVWTSEE